MRACFINFTNHPSSLWDEKQLQAAQEFGEIVELPFPSVDVSCEKEDIEEMAEELVRKICILNPSAVLCQGEFGLTYQVVKRLKEKKIRVLSACSERKVIQKGNEKVAIFRFEKFREY